MSPAPGKKRRNRINDWSGKSKTSQLLVSSHLAITAGRKLKKKNIKLKKKKSSKRCCWEVRELDSIGRSLSLWLLVKG